MGLNILGIGYFLSYLYKFLIRESYRYESFSKIDSWLLFSYIINMENNFWARVKRLMRSHKITQKNFATYIGIPTRTFWGWIHRDCIPDATRACAIAEALGVTVEYLVRGSNDINAEDRMRRTFERKSATEEIQRLAAQIGTEAKRLG